MNLLLTLLIIILVLEGISRTEITVHCCITDCNNITTWTLTYWLIACFFTVSWHPYVCGKHWELFEEIGKEDEVKLREKVEKK